MDARKHDTAPGRSFDRRTAGIIHLFAAAHAVTAVVTRIFDYYDDIPLTVLTILMVMIIAARRNLPLNITAAIIPFVTLLGYLAGVWCGEQLETLTGSHLLASAVTTFALTEIFGQALLLLTRRSGPAAKPDKRQTGYIRRLIIAACAILLLRITYSLLFRSPRIIVYGDIYDQISRLLSNTFASLMLVCGMVVFTIFPGRGEPEGGMRRIPLLVTLAGIVLFPLLLTAVVYYDFPLMNDAYAGRRFDICAFAGLYAVAMLATIIAYLVSTLFRYIAASHAVIRHERRKNLSEQYKYAKLKQQISPHFLFNSLNILDSLVQCGENERAEAYIRKLASLYRYVLKTEDDRLVTLDEELDFTEKYIDLLKERFTDGLSVDNRIPAELRRRGIVPCGLQMLIENAIKHNVVSAASPLRITIEADAGGITVTNNRQPRISTQPSTRLSLKNLSRQYADIAGRDIVVESTDGEFRVFLPLI